MLKENIKNALEQLDMAEKSLPMKPEELPPPYRDIKADLRKVNDGIVERLDSNDLVKAQAIINATSAVLTGSRDESKISEIDSDNVMVPTATGALIVLAATLKKAILPLIDDGLFDGFNKPVEIAEVQIRKAAEIRERLETIESSKELKEFAFHVQEEPGFKGMKRALKRYSEEGIPIEEGFIEAFQGTIENLKSNTKAFKLMAQDAASEEARTRRTKISSNMDLVSRKLDGILTDIDNYRIFEGARRSDRGINR